MKKLELLEYIKNKHKEEVEFVISELKLLADFCHSTDKIEAEVLIQDNIQLLENDLISIKQELINIDRAKVAAFN